MSKKKILVHVCCAPCFIYPLERLRGEGFEVSGFFYNPNIQPEEEYQKRKQTLKEYAARKEVKVDFYPEYSEKKFFGLLEEKKEKPERCRACWYERLIKSASFAKETGCDCFTTTLLVSPYQDTDMIRELAEKAACRAGVPFYFENFRSGYQHSVQVSREENIYRQKYCGCIFSLEERMMQKSVSGK